MNDRPNDIDGAVEGTCEWLLRHETYRDWTLQHRGLLWIKGKPGSGKSTLLKHVLRRVETRPSIRDEAVVLSFFFHGRGGELQRTPLGLFRSVLHQLLNRVPDALSHLIDTFQERQYTIGKAGEEWQWHVSELRGFFESSLPKVLERWSLWLFIDAMDECGEENAISLVNDFKRLIKKLPPTTSQFRICFSCRHYPILELDYGSAICLEYENGGDIATFVQAQFSTSRIKPASTIADTITRQASGVFMWARLVVKRVLALERHGEGLKKIQSEIQRIPPDLDALYDDLIQSMEPRATSRKLIQLICLSTKPLSIDELRWAMAIDPECSHSSLQQWQQSEDYTWDNETMERRIKTLSCGLAETVRSYRSQIVQFIHQSVKDFFVGKGLAALLTLDGNLVPSDMAVGLAHYSLSRICIRYLTMEEIARSTCQGRGVLESEFPLLHYATTSWVSHARQSQTNGICQEDLLEYFGWPSERLFQIWCRGIG
ncbi:hypothetical protein B0T10DRAFT_579858 [Thelonectria olida]|uniref:NACHT domain-containing protein n=1 Tax=Thelonectria olida TaxID=1576542 RepID=A0A9P9AIB8_9HYPO|nr:hypothetical protein B0T10DRAFT_579858 [Thelonectria olida]